MVKKIKKLKYLKIDINSDLGILKNLNSLKMHFQIKEVHFFLYEVH